MGLLSKEIFVCLDCETTGLDPVKDRLLEVAVVTFNNTEILSSFETLIDPQSLIPESSIAIHHITPEMVAGKPKIEEVLPNLFKLIGNYTIVGHGISFDVDLLMNAAKRNQIPCNLHTNKQLDTLRLARNYGQSPVNSLEKLREHFLIEPEGAHRAMNDVVVNVQVFKRLIERYKTTEQLFEVLNRPIRMKTMPLGPHKGKALSQIPVEYLKWAAYKDFDQDLLFSIRSELKKRASGNGFSQGNNPFLPLK